MKIIIFLLLLLFSSAALAKTFQVGPTRPYTAPSKVMNLVSDGDTVLIDAGLYSGDVGYWTKNDLVIRGIGGYAHLDAAGQNAGGKAIWVIDGKNTYIENIEFSGCKVADRNGAGIRQEADNLELRHCYFHDNEDGVLTSASPTSDILFEACEFARNGYGDGFSHNMYIGNVRSFTMRFCYSHHAKIGHCVKSRAMNNFIEYNRIMDEDTGSASYLIDLPNGGFSIVLGNTMQKGKMGQNPVSVEYGAEGLKNPAKQFYFVSNTIVSQFPAAGTFVAVANGTDTAKIINNIFCGLGEMYSGNADTVSNWYFKYQSYIAFEDTAHYDYLINAPYPDQNFMGIDPGLVNGISLRATQQYHHPIDSTSRIESYFMGALFEIKPDKVNLADITKNSILNFPNPFFEKTTINLSGIQDGTAITIDVYNQLGEKILAKNFIAENSQIVFERGNIPSGVYYYEIVNPKGERVGAGKFIVM